VLFEQGREAAIMKSILSLLIGMALVLSFGLAFGADSMSNPGNTSDKMIRDDDLERYSPNPDRATVNQMPVEPGAEGSAAGGVRSDDSENAGTDVEQGKTPADKGLDVPGTEGTGAGGADKEPGTYRY
jgi:hypothetical protein